MVFDIILVDDHQLVRDGFKRIIETSDEYNVIGSYSSAEEALVSSKIQQADILITDISLDSEIDGFCLIEQFKPMNPLAKIVILSMYESALYLQQAKKYQVNGFIHKREASELLLEALKTITHGENYFSNNMMSKLSQAEQALETFNRLYPREAEVFLLLAKGNNVKNIAFDLGIAVKTVHSHRLNIYKKFGFTSGFEITKFCLLHGIIDNNDF